MINNNDTQLEKLCGFYVSDWHFTTMLLPYINSKIDEKAKVITILEKDIEKNVKVLVEKLNLKNKENILNIKWSKISDYNYSNIEFILNNEISKTDDNIILINGSNNYIENINYILEKLLQKNKINSVKIINFFEVSKLNNIMDILDKHDKILNTSGEREINDIFENYHREKYPEKKVINNN